MIKSIISAAIIALASSAVLAESPSRLPSLTAPSASRLVVSPVK
jgi:hypothetical protein